MAVERQRRKGVEGRRVLTTNHRHKRFLTGRSLQLLVQRVRSVAIHVNLGEEIDILRKNKCVSDKCPRLRKLIACPGMARGPHLCRMQERGRQHVQKLLARTLLVQEKGHGACVGLPWHPCQRQRL